MLSIDSLRSFIMMNTIYLFHVLFVGPLLVKVGMDCTCKKNRMMTNLLLFLGLGVMSYHTYMMYVVNPDNLLELSIILVVGLGLILTINKHLL